METDDAYEKYALPIVNNGHLLHDYKHTNRRFPSRKKPESSRYYRCIHIIMFSQYRNNNQFLMFLQQPTRTSNPRRGRCVAVTKTRCPQAKSRSTAAAPSAIAQLCPSAGITFVHRAPADAPVAGWPSQSQFALQSSSISEWIISLKLLRNVLCTTFNANLSEHECER